MIGSLDIILPDRNGIAWTCWTVGHIMTKLLFETNKKSNKGIWRLVYCRRCLVNNPHAFIFLFLQWPKSKLMRNQLAWIILMFYLLYRITLEMNMALNQSPLLQSVNHQVFRPCFKCQKTSGETSQHCSALRLGPLEPWISTGFFWAISTGGWAMHPQNWLWNTRFFHLSGS